jgi:hypothetical protein
MYSMNTTCNTSLVPTPIPLQIVPRSPFPDLPTTTLHELLPQQMYEEVRMGYEDSIGRIHYGPKDGQEDKEMYDGTRELDLDAE